MSFFLQSFIESEDFILSLYSLLLLLSIILLPSFFQWLGYKYIAKEKSRFLPLLGKVFIGVIVLGFSIYFMSLYAKASFLNEYGVILSILLILLLYFILLIIWALLMSKWSSSFNFNSSAKASIINYLFFALLIVPIIFIDFPSKKINKISQPEIRSYPTYVDSKFSTNLDSILSLFPEKKMLFQYNDNSFSDGTYFEIYQFQNADEFLKLQNLIDEKPLTPMVEFLKVDESIGDGTINKRNVFPYYFSKYFKEEEGVKLADLIESLEKNVVYFDFDTDRRYYCQNQLSNILIQSDSRKFIKKRVGLYNEDEFDLQICNGYELHLLLDTKNKIFCVFRETMESCHSDGS